MIRSTKCGYQAFMPMLKKTVGAHFQRQFMSTDKKDLGDKTIPQISAEKLTSTFSRQTEEKLNSTENYDHSPNTKTFRMNILVDKRNLKSGEPLRLIKITKEQYYELLNRK